MNRLRGSQQGFSLVELLVVMLLLAIVGSIAAVGVARGLQADRQAQSRIEALEDMQIALERVSREVRAATAPLSADVLTGTADWAAGEGIEVDVLRTGDGDCVRYTYWIDADNDLRASEESSMDGCQTFAAPTERILLPALEPGSTVFSFQRDTYTSGERDPATDVDEIRFVEISFTRTLVEQDPVTMSTIVGLRNAR